MNKSTDILHHLDMAAPFIPFPIFWADMEARVIGANQDFLDLIGVRDLDQVAGKSPIEYYPEEIAQGMLEQTELVRETQLKQTREDVVRDITSGKIRLLAITRAPLKDLNGKMIGIIGTASESGSKTQPARHEEHSRQLISITEKEAYTNLAHKVAHDIQSPLTALSVILNVCDELSEAKRLILKNTFNAIKDIANNILNTYSRDENQNPTEEQRRLILCSDFLMKAVSERKYQYQEHPVQFDAQIAPSAQFSFIHAQYSQLGRALANLIGNAVESLNDRIGAKVSVKLEVDEETVRITVQDNGKGMSRGTLEKIMNRTRFTDGKENGHGLGMLQVWEMVESNGASLNVISEPGRGTSFELSFARFAKADWIIDEITFNSNDIILILDDDQLIHDAWDLRLGASQQSMPELTVRHEKQGQAVLDYVGRLRNADRKRVYLLCDFELINQDLHGLQIIEACGLERTILVTSYYANTALQKSAAHLGVKILPKQMASVVPIYFMHEEGIVRLNIDDVMYDKNFYKIDQPVEKYLS